MPANRLWGTGSPAAHSIGRAGRDELLDERGRRAGAELDDVRVDEGPIRDAGGPADDDRALEADAGRHDETDALVPAGSGELGELVVDRERAIRPRARHGTRPRRGRGPPRTSRG